MNTRFNMSEIEPEAYKAMFGLEKYLNAGQLVKTHKELLKIRASQINGCAFCLDMHTRDALQSGESNQRIFLLNAWRETDRFTEEEKAVLAITEEVTLIHQGGLSDETYAQAKQFFDERYIAQLIMAVVTINAWNRMAISSHLEVPE